MDTTERRRRRHPLAAAAVTIAVAASAAACAAGAGATTRPPAATNAPAHAAAEPAACRGLAPVREDHEGTIRLPPGEYGFPAGENFDAWSPGKPYVVATLDDTGLHFSPAAIKAAVYNVCFVDARSHRTGGGAVLDLFFDGGPLLPGLSVKAGTIGADLLCPVLDAPGVTIGNRPLDDPEIGDSLSISYGAGCPTVIS
jgi:hypothetical protein